MTTSIWPYTQERSTTCRFLVDLGTGLPLISEDPVIWVSSLKETSEFIVGTLGELLLGHIKESPDAIERIPTSASVTKDVLLYSSSRLIKTSVGDSNDVK